jgi:SAM-dependent methyltransferase
MKKRNKCVICDSLISKLFTIKMPVFMGIKSNDREDIIQDMNFMKCEECGEIQIEELIDLSELYYENHNIGIIGNIWENHYNEFSKFISNKIIDKTILEISDPSAKIAKKSKKFKHWYIVEPNPEPCDNEKVTFLKEFFDESFNTINDVDVIVQSHLLEHIHNPNEFLIKCHDLLKDDGSMFVSIPNMLFLIKNGYSPNNILHFEHTFYLDTEVLKKLLDNSGLEIVDEVKFKDHSVFYEIKKSKKIDSNFKISISDKFIESFITNKDKIIEINKAISDLIKNDSEYSVYIFGSHVTTQFYLYNGIDLPIKNILDNSPNKIGFKLYGTKLFVKSPEVIKDEKSIVICSHSGVYYNEIKDQLKKINDKVIIF